MVVLKGYKKRSATNFNKVEPVALYRSLTLRFLPLCLPNSSFRAFCRSNSVDQSQMRQVLKSEFQNIKTLPGYCCVNSRLYTEIYERFKQLCAQGLFEDRYIAAWFLCPSSFVSSFEPEPEYSGVFFHAKNFSGFQKLYRYRVRYTIAFERQTQLNKKPT